MPAPEIQHTVIKEYDETPGKDWFYANEHADDVAAQAGAVAVEEEDVDEEPVEEAESADSASDAPKHNARKDAWVEYAASVSDLTEEEADEFTKEQLIENFG